MDGKLEEKKKRAFHSNRLGLTFMFIALVKKKSLETSHSEPGFRGSHTFWKLVTGCTTTILQRIRILAN